MFKILAFLFALCLFQDAIAYCCFRDAWTLPQCGCPDVDTCGIITCNACTITPCGSTSCFRDTSNVCCDSPSTAYSCFRNIGDCGGSCGRKSGCGGDCGRKTGCGCGRSGCCEERSYIYFPEVEYPVVALEMKPFYYGSC